MTHKSYRQGGKEERTWEGVIFAGLYLAIVEEEEEADRLLQKQAPSTARLRSNFFIF